MLEGVRRDKRVERPFQRHRHPAVAELVVDDNTHARSFVLRIDDLEARAEARPKLLD